MEKEEGRKQAEEWANKILKEDLEKYNVNSFHSDLLYDFLIHGSCGYLKEEGKEPRVLSPEELFEIKRLNYEMEQNNTKR